MNPNILTGLKKSIRLMLNGTFWGLLFAVAYAQSPLFTSNQNQYFLHGLARAGYGALNEDWLANTLDPTPLFSSLVAFTQQAINWQPVYYIYYAILLGLYLYTFSGILHLVARTERKALERFITLAVIILLHSAALRFTLSRLIGVNWAYVLEDGVADQRMLGPVLQPSAFGVLLLLSVFWFLKGWSIPAILACVAAASIHPTYLFAAMLLTAAYMLCELWETRRLVRPLLDGLIALLAVLPVLYYVLTSFSASSAEAASRSRQILIDFRIPHHAVIGQWLDATVVFKLLLVAAALFVLWLQVRPAPTGNRPARPPLRLLFVLGFTSLASILLTLLAALVDFPPLTLLFPWRISILLVPLALATLLSAAGDVLLHAPLFQRPALRPAWRLLAALVIFGSVLVGAIRFKLDLDRKTTAPERKIQQFIYTHNKPGSIYLIPVKMQDFRLEAGAPVYVEFKSIPYRDQDVIEWYRRERQADRFYQTGDCSLLALIRSEGVTHAVLPAGFAAAACPGLTPVYTDEYFTLAALQP